MSRCYAALLGFWCLCHVHGFVPQGWHLNGVRACLKNSCASQSMSSLTHGQLPAGCGGGSHSQPASTAVLGDLLPFPRTICCQGLSREEQRHLASQCPWALHQQRHPSAQCAVHRQVPPHIHHGSGPTLARVKRGHEASCVSQSMFHNWQH